MAVTGTSQSPKYVVNGVGPYGTEFKFFKNSEVKPFIDGEEYVGGFSVTGAGDDEGGSLTFSVAPPEGSTLIIQRAVPYDQVDFLPREGDSLPARTLENAIDRNVMQAQQLADCLNSVPKAKPGDTPPSGSFRQAPLTVLGQDDEGNLLSRTAQELIQFLSLENPSAEAIAAAQVASSAESAAIAAKAEALLAAAAAQTAEQNVVSLYAPLQARVTTLEGGVIRITNSAGVTTGYGNFDDSDLEKGNALTAALVAAQPGDFVEVAAGNFLMRELGNSLKSNVTYFFRNSNLYIDNGSTYTGDETSPNYNLSLFYTVDVEGFDIQGNLTLDGQDRVKWGFVLGAATDCFISGISFIDWGSRGLWTIPVAEGSVGTSRKGVRVSQCYARGCNVGFELGAEYARMTDCTAYLNTTGITNGGGNNRYTSCSSTYNTTNFRLKASPNGGHGAAIGCDFNHATSKNAKVDADFVLGWTFNGCHFYDEIGSIDLAGSGVSFVGGDIACPVVSTNPLLGITDMTGVNFQNSTIEARFAGLSAADRAKVIPMGCKEGGVMSPSNVVPRASYPEFSNNADAITGGLLTGDSYLITGTGEPRIVI